MIFRDFDGRCLCVRVSILTLEFHGFPASSSEFFREYFLNRHVPTAFDQILPFVSPFERVGFLCCVDSSSVDPRSSFLFFFAGMCLQEDY